MRAAGMVKPTSDLDFVENAAVTDFRSEASVEGYPRGLACRGREHLGVISGMECMSRDTRSEATFGWSQHRGMGLSADSGTSV